MLEYQYLKKLWDTWDLRGFILLSLCLQSLLILAAPLRKQIRSIWLILPLWSAYLLADWAATFALGLIINSQIGKGKEQTINPNLVAFWAPFLLVHLGGPDAISAFSLEDNELWFRHLLLLISQACAVAYALYQTIPHNPLLIPTICMFLSGLIKYSERTMSLYGASSNKFRDSWLKDPDPGPDYARIMDQHRSMKLAGLPMRIDIIDQQPRPDQAMHMDKLEIVEGTDPVLNAYHFFKIFKGLIVDIIFTSSVRNMSREFFHERKPRDAFEVITIELNFMYDVLFTKVGVVYTKWGCFGRSVALGLVIASLNLFYKLDKQGFLTPDVTITYTLLFGAIALDAIAIIMLVTSNWFLVYVKKLPPTAFISRLTEFGLLKKLRRLKHGRWFGSVPCFNLINYCINPPQPEIQKIMDFFNLIPDLDGIRWHVSNEDFTDQLRNHIFVELKLKSELAEDLEIAKVQWAARGDLALSMEIGGAGLLHYVREVDYDKSLLTWHIATEICWSIEKKKAASDLNPDPDPNPDVEVFTWAQHREFSKLLSDYMLYLLVMQPTMMSAVAGIGHIRFRETCAETKSFMEGTRKKEPRTWRAFTYALERFSYNLRNLILALLAPILSLIFSLFITVFLPLIPEEKIQKLHTMLRKCKCYAKILDYFTGKKKTVDEKQLDACEKIHAFYTELDLASIKADRSKSVLFDGCRLANELRKMGDRKWIIMSRVWVEMLSHAAVRCRPNAHAQQLRNGGELITIVWLLMAHFGLGEKYQIIEEIAKTRAKLIIDK